MNINQITSSVNAFFSGNSNKIIKVQNATLTARKSMRHSGKYQYEAQNGDTILLRYNKGLIQQSNRISENGGKTAKKYFYDNSGKLTDIIHFDGKNNPIKRTVFKDNKIVYTKIDKDRNEKVLSVIKFNNEKIPYNSDVSITVYKNNKPSKIRYYKDGKYTHFERITEIYTAQDDDSTSYIQADIFDRINGERYKIRRYSNGVCDILLSGGFGKTDNREIEHRNSKNETTGYTLRKFKKSTRGEAYFVDDRFCPGDKYYFYTQMEYDKNRELLYSFNGMYSEYGKLI